MDSYIITAPYIGVHGPAEQFGHNVSDGLKLNGWQRVKHTYIQVIYNAHNVKQNG